MASASTNEVNTNSSSIMEIRRLIDKVRMRMDFSVQEAVGCFLFKHLVLSEVWEVVCWKYVYFAVYYRIYTYYRYQISSYRHPNISGVKVEDVCLLPSYIFAWSN